MTSNIAILQIINLQANVIICAADTEPQTSVAAACRLSIFLYIILGTVSLQAPNLRLAEVKIVVAEHEKKIIIVRTIFMSLQVLGIWRKNPYFYMWIGHWVGDVVSIILAAFIFPEPLPQVHGGLEAVNPYLYVNQKMMWSVSCWQPLFSQDFPPGAWWLVSSEHSFTIPTYQVWSVTCSLTADPSVRILTVVWVLHHWENNDKLLDYNCQENSKSQ